MIFEVIGKPAEHLTSTLNEIAEKIKGVKGVELTNHKINESAPFKAKEGFFTNFMELEAKVDDLEILSNLMFIFMPAHVEILEPENIQIQNNTLNTFFNGLMRKLHGYDEVTRVAQTEKMILQKKLEEIMKSQKKD
ncbi:hypothetical protein HOD88_02030 [archaeon]|jgi:hypothetical protein|nr:hypothetical protein [archaeon]